MAEPKVLLISSRPLEHSGMTKVLLDIAKYSRETFDFHLACGFNLDKEHKAILEELRIEYMQLSYKYRVIRYLYDIYKMVRMERYDKVYIHGNSPMMIIEALPCKIAGATVVTHCHNSGAAGLKLRYYLVKPFFNLIVDCKIGCSINASKWAYCGNRITTIKNGIDTERFAYNPIDRDTVRKELGLDNKMVVGHIGTFNVQKNYKKLIDVFLLITRKKYNARLLLIGDGKLKEEVSHYIKCRKLEEYVIMPGHVNNPESYYQAMDVLIITSLHEGLCLSALEAQACGLPVLINKTVSEETFVIDRCIGLGLSDSDEIWANKAISMSAMNRMDMTKVLTEKGYGFMNMMESIKNLLLD